MKQKYMFFWNSCFFDEPTDVGNFISGSSAFLKYSLYIWKFLVHVLLKPNLKGFEHYLSSMWNECNCMVEHSLAFWEGDFIIIPIFQLRKQKLMKQALSLA